MTTDTPWTNDQLRRECEAREAFEEARLHEKCSDTIATLERDLSECRAALAECAHVLRIVCSVWPARFNEFSTSDGGKLVSVNPQATLDAARALATKEPVDVGSYAQSVGWDSGLTTKEPQPAAKEGM